MKLQKGQVQRNFDSNQDLLKKNNITLNILDFKSIQVRPPTLPTNQ